MNEFYKYGIPAGLAAFLVFVGGSTFLLHKINEPSTAAEIRDFIQGSPCRVTSLSKLNREDEVITARHLRKLAELCDVLDDQAKAIRSGA